MIDIEKKLNIKFPKEYMDFVNNISNNKKIILLDNGENILIKHFLSLNEEEDSIVKTYNEFKDVMLEGIIPIAVTGDEDYICMYYEINREKSPKVILWSYELALENRQEGIFIISNSFIEFIQKLK